jgi:cyanate permease
MLISLITAINQVTYTFGPGIVGLLRDASGSYALPFYGCIGLELIAAVLIMLGAGAANRRGRAGA